MGGFECYSLKSGMQYYGPATTSFIFINRNGATLN